MQISDHEAGNPAEPVQNHGNPHADGSVSHLHADHITETDAEDKHGGDGHDHGIAHIVAGSEHIGQGEGQRPQEAGAAVVDKDKYPGKPCGLVAESIQSEDRVQDQEEDDIQRDSGYVCHDDQLFRIETHLLFVAGAHTLADDGDHGKIDGLSHENAHTVQIVGDAVGGNLHGAETGDDAHHEYASQLEDAVLHAAGDADVEDLLHHARIQMERLFHKADIQRRIA